MKLESMIKSNVNQLFIAISKSVGKAVSIGDKILCVKKFKS